MAAKILKKFNINNNKRLDSSSVVYLFDSQYLGKIWNSKHQDFELTSSKDISDQMHLFLDGLAEGHLVKFYSTSKVSFKNNENLRSRAKAISSIGYIERDLRVSVQKKLPSAGMQLKSIFSNNKEDSYEQLALDFDQSFDEKIFTLLNLELKPAQFENDFNTNSIKISNCGLQIEDEYLSIIKLQKLSTNPLSVAELPFLRESLPLPNEIVLSLEKLDERSSQVLLKVKSKQEESSNDLISMSKKEESDNTRAEILLQGKKLFKIELTIILKGHNQEELIAQSHRAKRELKRLGDFEVETFGAYECYRSALFGEGMHVTNYELIDKIDLYSPIYTVGNDKDLNISPMSFVFHRDDNTIDFLDPFNPSYSNQSGIVIGKSGRGKSVFVNNLLRCLDFDEKASILLVDVKGSHINTVEMLGGTRHEISATNSCGISPFEFLRIRRDHQTIEIILDFIEKIMLEDGELTLTRAEQVQVETEFMNYVESGLKDPSIDEFLKFSNKIPRRESLERWRKSGLYGKLFSPYQTYDSKKVQYFDFKDIVTASKGVVSTAVMSAIMAHFNFRLLDKKTDEKLIFIADETPFFVRNCFSSFNLLQKNLRKLGGSQILVAQNLSDLVVGGDTSLVNQTEFRIFFSTDEGSKNFKEVSGLSDESIKKLSEFNVRRGKYSEFILKDPSGERKGRLVLSKEEYLRATTFADDNHKIERLQELLNISDKNTAIEILASIQEEYAV